MMRSTNLLIIIMCHGNTRMGVEGAGLVPWMGGPVDASFGFYLTEALQSQTNTEKVVYSESR